MGSHNTVNASFGVAIGYGNEVSGNYGFAAGAYNIIAGGATYSKYSAVFGERNVAMGENCFVAGEMNTAGRTIGPGSWQGFATALGSGCRATGYYSFAAGKSCDASGTNSIAMGQDNSANSATCIALGYNCTAGEPGGYGGAVAMGVNAVAKPQGSFALGTRVTAGAEYSVAMGRDCSAGGLASFADGSGCVARGNYSFATGTACDASGKCSVAMGQGNTVSGVFSVAIGENHIVRGANSVAMGWSCEASGNYAVAMGKDCSGVGSGSVAMGVSCGAHDDYTVAMGHSAHTAAPPWFSSSPEKALFLYRNDSSYFGLDSAGIFRVAETARTASPSAPTTVKTFVIPHPEHEGKMLRHACIEAPTRGTNIYEYQLEATESNQTTEIALPSYFKYINGRPRVYVSAENVFSACYGKVNEDLTHAIIKTEKPGVFNVLVTGVRKDPGAVKYAPSIYIDEPIAPEDIPPTQTVMGCGSNHCQQ